MNTLYSRLVTMLMRFQNAYGCDFANEVCELWFGVNVRRRKSVCESK